MLRAPDPRRWPVVALVARHCPGLGLLLAATTLLSAVLPAVAVAAGGDAVSRAAAALGRDPGTDDTGLLVSAAVTIVALGLSFLVDIAQDALGTLAASRLTYSMQARLMSAVLRPTGTAHLEQPGVLDRIGLATGTLTDFRPAEAPGVVAKVAGARLCGLAACVLLGTVHWWLGVLVLAMWLLVRAPLRGAIVANVRAFAGDAAVMRRARYFQHLSASREAAKEIRLFGMGDWLVGRLERDWRGAMAAVWRLRARLQRTVVGIGALVVAANLALCAWIAIDVGRGGIGLRDLVVLMPALMMASGVAGISLDDISLEWMRLGLPALRDLETDLGRVGAELGGARTATGRLTDAVRFEAVRFGFGDHAVLDGVDLSVEAGRSCAIVGDNGAGKTTLVRLLARLSDPQGGRVLVDGEDLRSLRASEWQRRIAVVTQDFARFPVTLAENVTLGAVEHADDREGAERALRRAGGADLPAGLARGWDTVLAVGSTDGVELSGGQWQRVALARALFAVEHGADILVLDEPTSWLDTRGEADFYQAFLDLTRGLTTIVVSHRFSTVRRADTIHVLAGGRVSESGNHDELMAFGGRYAAMFRLQAGWLTGAPTGGAAR